MKLLIPPNEMKYIRRREECSFGELYVINSSFFSKNKFINEQL